MEDKEFLGSLFGVINYKKNEDLEKFINNMKKDQAFYCLIQAVNYAYSKNVFNMQEAEVLSKSVRLVTNKEEEKFDPPEPEVYEA
jgi:hypothetical protein